MSGADRPGEDPDWGPAFSYGVAWYPEWGPGHTWRGDLDGIERAGFTAVRIGEFAWATLEPTPGYFNFGLFDEVVSELEQRGLGFVLGVDTTRPPEWVFDLNPGIHLVDDEGKPAPGTWPRHCFNNPAFKELSGRYIAAVITRYKASTSLLFYQVDNEPAYHSHSVASLERNWFCYCDHCQRGYAGWLEAGYEQEKRPLVANPFPRPYEMGELAWLEWRKFHDDTNIRRTKWVCDEVRKFDRDHKLTTNIMVGSEFGPSTSPICHDVTGLAQSLDVMGMDFYPDMRGTAPKRDRLVLSLSDQLGHPGGFHCLETQGTTYAVPMGHWDGQEKGFRAYEPWDKLVPQFWRAVAYGAQSLFYWVWRLRADNVWALSRPDGSLVEESVVRTAALSTDVARLWPRIRGGQRGAPRVAVVFTRDSSHLATRHDLAEANGEAVLNSFDAASRFEQPVDVVELGRWDGDLDQYAVVIAPFLYVLSKRTIELLESFVARGGTLVWGARSGSYPEPPQGWEEVPVASAVRLPSDAVPPPPLDRVLGFTRQGLRLYDPTTNEVEADDRRASGLPMYTFYAEVVLNEGTEVLETMPDGRPAVVRHQYGDGNAWSVLIDAFSSVSSWLVALTGRIFSSSGLSHEFLDDASGAKLDDGWETVRRDLPHGGLVFLINSSERNWPAHVGVPKESAVRELLEDRHLGVVAAGEGITAVVLDVPPQAVRILRIGPQSDRETVLH